MYLSILSIGFLLAVGNGMGREKAFCSSKFYAEATANPTKFCTAQGLLIHYFSVALALWFVVYSINLLQVNSAFVKHCQQPSKSIHWLLLSVKSATCTSPL